jgi:nucleotide-binding universal stress UspA family protein
MFKKILVPLDGSRFSGRALIYASEIAKRFGGELMLFQAVSPTSVVTLSGGGAAQSAHCGFDASLSRALRADTGTST